jgi:amino acid adenylation domain-containing protein/non-ribosomal peptide synthase protein (TIGR01720 family)
MMPSPPALDEVRTVAGLLRERALSRPDRLAYTYLSEDGREESTLTYCQLDRRARAIAVALREYGISRGRALLVYPPGLDFLPAFFGCLYAGVVAVPAYPPDLIRLNRTLPRLRAIAADAQPIVALTVSAVVEAARPFLAEAPDLDQLRWVQTDSLCGIDENRWIEPNVSKDDLAFLQYTSGSTGSPKGVMVTHANLLHNAQMVYSAFEHTSEDIYVSWLPTFHDMGFMAGVLQPLFAALPAIEMSPISFLHKPARWLAAISRYKATTSGGPNFAYDLCVRRISDQDKAEIDLSSWTVAFNGAEPVRQDTLDRFSASFESCGFRREAFYPCYGLAEATLIVTGGHKSEPPILATANEFGGTTELHGSEPSVVSKKVVGCGRALLDQRIAIVDPDTLVECALSHTGEVWIRGLSVAQGYWNRRDETRAAFESFLEPTGDGPFLRTGDLGFMRQGELFVTGRLKDLIIIRGANHYPQDIELTVESADPALRPGCGAAFSIDAFGEERLVVIHEVDAQEPDLESVIERIRAAIATNHELQVHSVALLKPGTVSKTSSGKIQRRECRTAFMNGSLQAVAQWRAPDSQLEQPTVLPPLDLQTTASWLRHLVARKAGVDEDHIDLCKNVVQHGLDSLNAVEISHLIEDQTGVALGAGELLRSSTILELAETVFTRANNRPSGLSPSVVGSRNLTEYPLSHGQRGLWFLQKIDPHSPVYNIAWAVRVRRGLDVESLRAALQQLVDRHPSLRTTFLMGRDGPIQRVLGQMNADLTLKKSAGWSDESVIKRMEEEAQRPFDLERGPLLKVSVFERPGGEYSLLLGVHHLIVDFWSLSLIVHELGALYDAALRGTEAELPPLTLQYCHYVLSEADLLGGNEGASLWRYWSERLRPIRPALSFPTDRLRPPGRTYNGDCLLFKIDRRIADRLAEIARNYGVTLYTTLLAGFQTLLHRYTGEEHIVVGSPVSGRTLREFEPVVGYFANMLPLCAEFSSGLSFAALLAQAHQSSTEALDHQQFPFSLLVDRLHATRDLSQPPLFQVAFTLQKSELPGGKAMSLFGVGNPDARMTLGGLELEAISLPKRTAEYDITLSMADADDGLAGSFQYNTDLFDHTTIQRLAVHFQALLESVTAAPELAVSRASLLGPKETGSLILSQNNRRNSCGKSNTLVELFEEQVSRTPDGVAASFEDASLCYAELNTRANKLARVLRGLGAGPDVCVGICVERSLDTIVGLLGILKAGAAYVPLDPAYPAERLSLMLRDSAVRLLVTQQSQLVQLGNVLTHTIILDRDWDLIDLENGHNLNTWLSPANAAYVIYTSGSTGIPKGVVVTHWNVVRLLENTSDTFNFSADDVWTLFHSYAFDFSVWEMWGSLIHGGRLVIVPFWVSRDPAAYQELLASEAVSIVNQTPSAFRQLTDLHDQIQLAAMPALRAVILGGEALDLSSLRRWIDARGDLMPKIINMYGITETTVHVTHREITVQDTKASPRSPIGEPISDLQIYILDPHLQPAPISVAGEICVGGQGIARGYLNQPPLTAKRFTPDPWSSLPGGRMYRSGDLGRLISLQDVEYLGRLDDQVKIRGFRVELGEIEAALNSHQKVAQSAVIAFDDSHSENRLIAYVVPLPGKQLSPEDLKRFLTEKLPAYMLPAAIVLIDDIPLTAHGKLDRKALPAVDWARRDVQRPFAPPSNPIEQTLAEAWSSVLGIPSIGINDNFFDLGGDSILSMQVVSRARDLGLELSPKHIFQHQVIKELAVVARQASRLATSCPVIEPEPVDQSTLEKIEDERGPIEDVFPLSWTQQGILFHTLSGPGTGLYVTQVIFEITGALNDEAFQRAWQILVDRHQLLRAEFEWEGVREPVQIVKKEANLSFQQLDWRRLGSQEQHSRLEEFLSADRRLEFDLRTAPLMRVASILVEDQVRWCVWSSHHLILDGWSAAIALKDVFDFYDTGNFGGQPDAVQTPSFREFILWLRRQDQSAAEKFWREALDGFTVPTQLRLMCAPTPYRGPGSVVSGAGDDCSVSIQTLNASSEALLRLPMELTLSLESLARSHRITLSSVIQCVWAIALSRYSGDEDVLFGVTVGGRPPQLEAVESRIGMFITTLPLRVHVPSQLPAIQLLKDIQNRSIDLQDHQYVPLAKIQEWSAVPSGTGLFESIIVFENYPVDAALAHRRSEPTISNVRSIEQTNYPLTIAAIPGDELALVIGYEAQTFDSEAIQRVLSHLRTLVESLVRAPHSLVCDLEMLSAAERLEISRSTTGAERVFDDLCLHELFQDRAAGTPDAVALIFEEEWVTYGQVALRCDEISRQIAASGVLRGECVAVRLERCPDLIATILGVLKLGCIYLPVDPHLPRQRLSFLLKDAGARLVITNAIGPDLFQASSWAVLDLRAMPPLEAGSNGSMTRVSTSEIAYVIYTSGSTGKPKGVMVSHAAISNHMQWMAAAFPLCQSDRVLQKYSISFDASIGEIFYPLISGAAIVITPPGAEYEVECLIDIISQEQVTTIDTVPSMLKALLEDDRITECKTLRRVLSGGEILDPALPGQLFSSLPGALLVNVYGPTETTITATCYCLERDFEAQSVPIGSPICNTATLILDKHLRLQPMGVMGEICIAGSGLSQGYVNRPELTAEHFVPNPCGKIAGGRLYRTGDLGLCQPDGAVAYAGRSDQQIKLRGFRIEPAEIEAVLNRHPRIKASAVVLREDESGQGRLVAYFATQGVWPPVESIRDHLRNELPHYMLPSQFVHLDELPLTASGKVDRSALSSIEPHPAGLEANYEEPRNEIEWELARIWGDVLGLTRVGIRDHFFEIGGDSILSIQIAARVKEAGISITPRQVFEHPTIAGLAAICRRMPTSETLKTASGFLPLTPIQRWFFEQQLPLHWYNQAVMLEVAAEIDATVAEKALRILIEHHDSLRLRFELTRDGWQQRYAPTEEEPIFSRRDLSRMALTAQQAVLERAANDAQASLNIADGPMLRAVWFDLGKGCASRLLLLAHHLTVDAVSWRIVIADLERACNQLQRGEEVSLPAKTLPYGRWSELLVEQALTADTLGELEFWSAALGEDVNPLPVDDKDGENTVGSVRTLLVRLSADDTRRMLQNAPQVFQVKIDELLMAAIVCAFSSWAGGGKVLLDVEGHGREPIAEDADVSNTVGWFTAIFPVVLTPVGCAQPAEVLASVREQLRRIPGKGLGYGLLRYLSDQPQMRRILEGLPRAQVSFNYLGRFDTTLARSSAFALASESVGQTRDPLGARSHLIEIDALIKTSRLEVAWSFSHSVHDLATIRALAQEFNKALNAFIDLGATPEIIEPTVPVTISSERHQSDGTRISGPTEPDYALSPMQKGLLFHSLYEPDSYLTQLICTLTGTLDPDAFQAAWQLVVDRIDVLRTGFEWEGVDEPVQIVKSSVALATDNRDWRGFEDHEQPRVLAQFLNQDRRKRFDLRQAPLLRLTLIRTCENAYEFILSSHHLLIDGWSLSIVVKEFFAAYQALCAGTPVNLEDRRPYRDYIAWLAKQDPEPAKRAWSSLLDGFSQPTRIAQPLNAEQTRTEAVYDYLETSVGDDTYLAMGSFARAEKLTLNTVCQGVWGLLLSIYSGNDDVAFGAVTSGRSADLSGIESMVGLFINTLPVRVRVPAKASVAEWLTALQSQQAAIRDYEFCSLSDVQAWSDVPPGVPLFETLFVFQNYPLGVIAAGLSQERPDGLNVENVRSIERSNYPLTVWLVPGASLLIRIGYNRERFQKHTMQELLEGFSNLLDAILANCDDSLGNLMGPLIMRSRATPGERPDVTEEQERTWPHTAVETVIARFWCQLLGLERVKLAENFFDIGGDPVLAKRLLDLLRNSLKVEVSLTAFLKTPTVAGLSQLASEGAVNPGSTERIAAILNRIENMSEEDVKTTVHAKERHTGDSKEDKHIAGRS